MRLLLFLPPLLVSASQPAAAHQVDPVVGRMLVLYDEVCLRAFPDDVAVDALMEQKGAEPLTPEQVSVTFNDDPGRGWLVPDDDRRIQVMLELPPFHACSVRRRTESGLGDPAAYNSLIEPFIAARPGFERADPYSAELNGMSITATVLRRETAEGIAENLLVVEQRGLTEEGSSQDSPLVDLRFVHQLSENRNAKPRQR